MWRSTDRASLEKKPSTRLSQEPCLGVKVNWKRPAGGSANTADVTTLLPVVDRLRQRFSIGRVCVVADRGMISAATIAGLEERKLEYLGARERSEAIVRKIVHPGQSPGAAGQDRPDRRPGAIARAHRH
jgi:hypothetical protein